MLLELVTALCLAQTPIPRSIPTTKSTELQAIDGTPRSLSEGLLDAVLVSGVASPKDGYAPVRVKLRNNSNKPVPVELRFAPSGAGGNLRRVVQLAPNEQRTVLLPIPGNSRYGSLTISSPALRRPVTEFLQSSVEKNVEFLLVGPPDDVYAWLGEVPDSDAYGAAIGTLRIAGPELWDEFAGYVGFELIVIANTPFRELPRGAQRALEAYVATGGTLVLSERERGLESALPLLADAKVGGQSVRYGLGEIVFCASRDGCPLPWAGQMPLVQPAQSNYLDYGSVQPLLTAPATAVGPFLLIMLAFAFAVGPGAVWVAKNRGSLLLLFFIPALSLATVFLLVLYSVVADGFGVRASINGITYLDAKSHRAFSLGVGGFYANLAPNGPEFGTYEVPIGEAYPSRDVGASIDWSEGTKFGSDFLRTRAYQEWAMRSAVESRARVSVTGANGEVKLQNGLGAPISQAVFRRGGELYVVQNLPDGREGAGKRITGMEQLRARLTALVGEQPRFDKSKLDLVTSELRDGEFVALLGAQAPWMTFGKMRLNVEESWHLVRGEVAQ